MKGLEKLSKPRESHGNSSHERVISWIVWNNINGWIKRKGGIKINLDGVKNRILWSCYYNHLLPIY